MQYLTKLAAFAAALTLSTHASARDEHYDGSDPLLCTAMTAQICDIYGCERAARDEISGVKHLVVDFKRDRVASVRGEGSVAAAIKHMERNDNRLFLQGVNEPATDDDSEADEDNARGWTMAIADPTGMMTLTVAGEEEAIVIFGACAPVE